MYLSERSTDRYGSTVMSPLAPPILAAASAARFMRSVTSPCTNSPGMFIASASKQITMSFTPADRALILGSKFACGIENPSMVLLLFVIYFALQSVSQIKSMLLRLQRPLRFSALACFQPPSPHRAPLAPESSGIPCSACAPTPSSGKPSWGGSFHIPSQSPLALPGSVPADDGSGCRPSTRTALSDR